MPIRILVLSDVDELRNPVITALREKLQDCVVYESKNPIDGLIQAQEQPIHLIYCGAILTGFSGAKFIEELRKSKPHVPVIAMSTGISVLAREEDNAVSAMLCLGATKYLKMPFTDRDIVSVAQEIMNSTGRTS